VALSEGHLDEARRLYEEGLTMRRTLGDRRGVASSLNGLARVMLDTGQVQAALTLLQESLSIRQSLGDKRGIVECLENFVYLSYLQQRPDQAARLLGLCATQRDTLKTPRPLLDQARFDTVTQALRDQLTEPGWQTAWDAGRALNLTPTVVALLA
jgi:tetratricopeptide (TPR) repeat protein